VALIFDLLKTKEKLRNNKTEEIITPALQAHNDILSRIITGASHHLLLARERVHNDKKIKGEEPVTENKKREP
jgi:hypothetical protein